MRLSFHIAGLILHVFLLVRAITSRLNPGSPYAASCQNKTCKFVHNSPHNRRRFAFMIDLRSDTVTVPTDGMLEAISRARVGDDVYGEDSTVNMLQDRLASLFGKEAALFVPSGTMANQICVALHAGAGDEVIVDANAHIFHYENGATSVISRAQLLGIETENGEIPIASLLQARRSPAYHNLNTALVALENTHNRLGGLVLSLPYLAELSEFTSTTGIPLHCDGARIWNAAVATGASYRQLAEPFSTLSVCLSKGLGAPAGSVILGSAENIRKARRWRKLLGGGMRQAGILAAAGLYALDHILPSIGSDHYNAQIFAESLSIEQQIRVNPEAVQSNIVLFQVPIPDDEFIEAMSQYGIKIQTIRPGIMRAVFHHQIHMLDAVFAGESVCNIVKGEL